MKSTIASTLHRSTTSVFIVATIIATKFYLIDKSKEELQTSLINMACLNLVVVVIILVRDGRPVPRGTLPAGKGGFPAPPRAVGRGGFPAPPRPVKMIKTAGKLRGKINTRISTFSKRGNK